MLRYLVCGPSQDASHFQLAEPLRLPLQPQQVPEFRGTTRCHLKTSGVTLALPALGWSCLPTSSQFCTMNYDLQAIVKTIFSPKLKRRHETNKYDMPSSYAAHLDDVWYGILSKASFLFVIHGITTSVAYIAIPRAGAGGKQVCLGLKPAAAKLQWWSISDHVLSLETHSLAGISISRVFSQLSRLLIAEEGRGESSSRFILSNPTASLGTTSADKASSALARHNDPIRTTKTAIIWSCHLYVSQHWFSQGADVVPVFTSSWRISPKLWAKVKSQRLLLSPAGSSLQLCMSLQVSPFLLLTLDNFKHSEPKQQLPWVSNLLAVWMVSHAMLGALLPWLGML